MGWIGEDLKEEDSSAAAVLVECSEMNTNRIVVLNLISSFCCCCCWRLGSGRLGWFGCRARLSDGRTDDWVVHYEECSGVAELQCSACLSWCETDWRANKTFNLSQLFRARHYCLGIKKFFRILWTGILCIDGWKDVSLWMRELLKGGAVKSRVNILIPFLFRSQVDFVTIIYRLTLCTMASQWLLGTLE